MIAPSARPARVLVVDDHAINVRLTRRLLAIDGHAALTAGSGAAALEAATELAPDLVLADLFLADMSGVELVACIRGERRTAGLRVVAFTAAAMDADREAALDGGFDDYLAKPVSAAAFTEFVATQLLAAGRESVEALG
jgi:two-component system cell cycle response regulator DivK